jgi:hypothetical protein
MSREWDFCDQCIFWVPCMRTEKRKGDGCAAFSPYPYSYAERRGQPNESSPVPATESHKAKPRLASPTAVTDSQEADP